MRRKKPAVMDKKWIAITSTILLLITLKTISFSGNGTEPPQDKSGRTQKVFIEISTKKNRCESFPNIHWAGVGKVMPRATAEYARTYTQAHDSSTEQCRVTVSSAAFDRDALSGFWSVKPSSVNNYDFVKSNDSNYYSFFAKFTADSIGACKFVCITRDN